MPFDGVQIIERLPLPILRRMELERFYLLSGKRVKSFFSRGAYEVPEHLPLVRNNRLYGNELILRNYASRRDDLLAIIEHGVYFGRNTAKVGIDQEWELGCILTNGIYRKQTIHEFYPDYYCEAIGPLIAYAETDLEFKNSLQDTCTSDSRSALFFPVHASDVYEVSYEIHKSFRQASDIAKAFDCNKLIISVLESDYHYYRSIIGDAELDLECVFVTCGNRYKETFLPRQRALIESVNITISNSLGTHIGYCVYLNRPHIFLPVDYIYQGSKRIMDAEFGDKNFSRNTHEVISNERAMFQEVFANAHTEDVTEEQIEVCNYYWGLDRVKTPDEIGMIYQKCRDYCFDFIGR